MHSGANSLLKAISSSRSASEFVSNDASLVGWIPRKVGCCITAVRNTISPNPKSHLAKNPLFHSGFCSDCSASRNTGVIQKINVNATEQTGNSDCGFCNEKRCGVWAILRRSARFYAGGWPLWNTSVGMHIAGTSRFLPKCILEADYYRNNLAVMASATLLGLIDLTAAEYRPEKMCRIS
jgi:hypothetical protein